MELGLLFAVCTAFYFLPSWLGTGKRNSTSIFLLNLLLGWTLVGWVVALVWATTKEAEQAPPATPIPSPPSQPAPLPADPQVAMARLRDLRDRGIISQEVFLQEIARL